VQLFKSYCLPFILYATEAISLNKRSVKKLDDCIQRAVGKIFNVKDNNNIAVVRQSCDLPFIGKIIECRREKFISKLLDSQFLSCLFKF